MLLQPCGRIARYHCVLTLKPRQSPAPNKDAVDKARQDWRVKRQHMEAGVARRRRFGVAGERAVTPLSYLFRSGAVEAAFRLLGLYPRGCRNAEGVRLETVTMSFADLPEPFDGYSILHLSDLHISESFPAFGRAAEFFRGLEVDLVVMSGDYQTFGAPEPTTVATLIERMLAGLVVRDGIVAVLGNHDSHEMAGALEEVGVSVLINEGLRIERGGAELILAGTDDVYYFHTDSAPAVLRNFRDGFRVALVHTPDLATMAAEAGYSLYLTGHTHGGQVCMPGGRPIMTGLDSHHALASGCWQWQGMLGHTSRGLGSGLVPVRFNCPPEATVINLKCTSLVKQK